MLRSVSESVPAAAVADTPREPEPKTAALASTMPITLNGRAVGAFEPQMDVDYPMSFTDFMPLDNIFNDINNLDWVRCRRNWQRLLETNCSRRA
jgi:hypothetical protein